ncbi:FKBP-type peptidyl-prolyl cis-trans isomerase [Microbacterium sp. EST19A]|uniref:FKBP-type peptidyl-prolyl cis-trans isomerase n=1 Tax=Microbacterium sp. EST19A TaxID=2862681 RepID=UPI001CC16566|nr:hypothetical protein [Microbacterium sp. EST19A]
MRKTSAVLASLSLAVLALTGCSVAGSSDGAACERPADSTGVADAVTVDGDLGSKPDVSIFAPVKITKSASSTVIEGDGRPVENGQQLVVLELTLFNGQTGEEVASTAYDPDKGALTNLDNQAERFPALASAMKCVTEGSRVVVAVSPEDAGAEALSGFGLGPKDTMVFVADALDVYLPRAEGELQFNDASGMPTVVRAPDGTPGVIIPDSAAPKSQVVQTLIKGEGEKLGADQIPLVNYTAVNWDTKDLVDTTWGKSVSLDFAQTAPAVAETLVGKPVGSQVLVVTPATGDVPATAYVVDILGAVTAPTQ